jgi:carboxylesterase 2
LVLPLGHDNLFTPCRGFTLGSASIPIYDGESFARNQDVVVVSFNYRTNVFGFPWASDLPPTGNNLGFLDQELALAWVQDNIAQFGGDKDQVTVMVGALVRESHANVWGQYLRWQGQSAGSLSISLAITRRNSSIVPPFRSAIMLSGAKTSASPVPNFALFEGFATAMGCSQSPGPERLDCLRKVPASTIRNFTNTNPLDSFVPQVDKYVFALSASGTDEVLMSCHVFGSVTFIDDSLQAIRTGQVPRVPILLGNMQDDGTIFTPVFPNLTVFLEVEFGKLPFFRPPNATTLQNLYPGLNDTQVFPAVARDVLFHWCVFRFLRVKSTNDRVLNKAKRNYGVMHLSQAG